MKRGKRIGRLKSSADVAAFIRRCIRESYREGGTTSGTAYKNVMMCSMLLKAIEASDLEQRLAALEEAVGERGMR
jgi:hypothetical protein